jgi:large conductance mechanosensitive channel
MSFIDDFKKFAFKGNVVDLAVGVVIGAAFGKIVTALVADLVMPFVALVMPSGDWRANGIVLRAAPKPEDAVVLKYGDFMGAVIDFFIIALVLFLVVSKLIKAAEGRINKPKTDAPIVKECPFCLESVPMKATRCKACTSELAAAPAS